MKRFVLTLLALLMLCLPVLSMAETEPQPTASTDVEKYELAMLCLQGNHDGSGKPDYAQAYSLFMEVAKAENTTVSDQALTQLGIGCYKGYFEESGEPDYAQAYELLMQGYANGSTLAANWLGDLHMNGHLTGEPDYEQARQYYLAAAEDNYAYAVHKLADGYLNGVLNGGVIDVEQALAWYGKADELDLGCANGHIIAIYRDGVKDAEGNTVYKPNPEAETAFLARLWEQGTTDVYTIEWYMYRLYYTVKDYDLAITVGEKGAELGSGYCMLHLGHIYHNVKNDPDTALAWYTKSTETNYSDALISIGNGYKDGFFNGGVPDGEAAAEWYRKAVEAGRDDAPAHLGKLYFTGIKGEDDAILFEADYAAALPYLELAVAAGTEDTYCYDCLGWIYSGNSDVYEADYEKAMSVYEAGAELGSKYCMLQLGLIYLNGELGEADVEKAIEWLSLAAEGDNAHPDAAGTLEYAKSLLAE